VLDEHVDPLSEVTVRSDHRLLDTTFRVSLIVKLADGILELVGGVLLLVISPQQIGEVVRFLTQHELAEDPHDVFANLLVHAAGSLSVSASLFGAIYLLVHGLVKVLLVAAVLSGRLWAYPWMIGFLVVFIGYQLYEMVVHFSLGLLLLTLFDIFIVVITVREYRLHREARDTARAESRSE
jgi:uncharacterized membrane protein